MFKDKGCEYDSKYRSRICPNRFPYNTRAYLRMKGSLLYYCKRAHIELYFPKSLSRIGVLKKNSAFC